MKETDRFRSRRVGNALNSLGQGWEEAFDGVTDVADSDNWDASYGGPYSFSNNDTDNFDPVYGGQFAYTNPNMNSNVYGDVETYSQSANAVSADVKQAAGVADSQPGVPVKIASTGESVVSTSKLPSVPDLNTLYKIGTELFKATGQQNAQGQAIYRQQSLASNNTMMLLLAAAAIMFLT